MVILALSGCNIDNSGTEPSPVATPAATKPIVPPDLSTPVEPDNLEKSLPFGKFDFVKGDEYYFYCTDLKDDTVDIYKYSKKTDRLSLFKDTDWPFIRQILFDGKDNFYYIEYFSEILYRCDEENDIPVINNISYVVYIEGEHIYFLDNEGTLNKYNIDNNTITKILYIGDGFYPYHANPYNKNICLLINTGSLYSLDVRNGSMQKIPKEYRSLSSSDKKSIINVKEIDKGNLFSVFNLDSFETTEYVINDFIDMYIDSIQIYNDRLYATARELDEGINIETDKIIYKYYLYIIDLNSKRIEDTISIFKTGEGELEYASFYNGKLYFYYWPNYDKGSSANIMEYDVETGNKRNIILKKGHGDLYGHMKIVLGHLWVFNMSAGDYCVTFIDKIAIE